MEASKKAAFVRMARRKFSKGGIVRKLGKRKYFDQGGNVDPYTGAIGGPNSVVSQITPSTYLENGIKNSIPNSPSQPSFQGSNQVNDSSTNPNTGILGTIGGALGLNNQFVAKGANLTAGTNAEQLGQAYQGAQQGLNAQGQLVNTLTPQAGSAVANQNALANQYLAMTQGQGPNPAKAELAQATGQNVANQAALMAGQRGAGANAGLIARQAAQQGAQTQQQAAGQAATLQAQQQIAAQQNLANLANNQISQTGQATTGLSSAQQGEQSILQNANTSANNAAVGMQSNINNVNAQTAAANQNMNANILGGIGSAASSISSLLEKGGIVGKDGTNHHLKLAEMNAASLAHAKKYDEGGEVDKPDLGEFKPSEDNSSAPNIPGTSTLPTDQTDFSNAMSGGGGKSGGGGGIMGLAAMLADGGPIGGNLLISQSPMNNSGWATFKRSSTSASSGPNIEGTSSLPTATENFSKDMQNLTKNKNKDTESVGEETPWETGGGLAGSPGDIMNNSAPSSPGMDIGDGSGLTEYAAKGGMMSNHFHNYFSEGGKVPAMVSPGEIYLSPDKVHKVIHEGIDPAKIGQRFKGKAKVKGDSLKNDIIPASLEEGGIVIDRKNMGTREKRELFVHRAMARKKARG